MRLRSHTVTGQLVLHTLAGLRRFRRHSQRHATEIEHINQWLQAVYTLMQTDYLLAVELIRCRQLIKGYSDTHARGSSKFDRLMQAATGLIGRENAAAELAALRKKTQAEVAVAKVP
jgi:indolepyruvate ferredoxin oxidoreductase beta subunit